MHFFSLGTGKRHVRTRWTRVWGAALLMPIWLAACNRAGLPAAPTRAMGGASLSEEAAIRAVLEQQTAAWNRGDIDGFMATYWPAADLTFSGAGQIRRGWATVRDRYKANYPTPQAMGRLTFTEIEVHALGPMAAFVLGHWRLTETPAAGGGVFSLVLQKIDGHWLIVHDHTSARPTAEAK